MEPARIGSHISPYQKQIRNRRKGQNTCMHENNSAGSENNESTHFFFFCSPFFEMFCIVIFVWLLLTLF